MARVPVLLFNLENGELEYAKFAISLYTGIDSAKLKQPSLLFEEELERVREAVRELARSPLYIKTMGAPTVQEIDRISRQHISRHGVKRIGVDYIQLIRNGIEKREQDVSMSSGRLRAMALNYKLPVMTAAQLNREIERRGQNSTPTLADLRESGSLEQDATMVWINRLLWPVPTGDQLRMFPDNVDNGELREIPRAVPIKIHVLKNRNGPVGETMPILWRKHVNDFNTITEFRE
jgi:replicative DNA helicase